MPGWIFVAVAFACLVCFILMKEIEEFFGLICGFVVLIVSIAVLDKAIVPKASEMAEYCVSSACKTEKITEDEYLRTEYDDKEHYVFRVDGRTIRYSEEDLIVLTSDEVDSPVFFTMRMDLDIVAWFCGKEYKTKDLLVIPVTYTNVVADRLEGSKYYNEISEWIE